MIWPVADGAERISSPFAKRKNPINGWEESHLGLDFAVPDGEPLLAVEDAKVLYARRAEGFGQWVVLVGKSGNTYVYGHMWDARKFVHEGMSVKEGQTIALAGANGQSTGPHLHFEVHPQADWKFGSQIDPLPFLRKGIEKASASEKISSGGTWDAVMEQLVGRKK